MFFIFRKAPLVLYNCRGGKPDALRNSVCCQYRNQEILSMFVLSVGGHALQVKYRHLQI